MTHAFDMSIPVGHWVDSESEAQTWIQHFLKTHKINNGLGLDSETTGLDKVRDKVIVWSLSDGHSRICLPSKFIPMFKEPILENPEICFDLTNAKFDAHMIANSGADISKAGAWRDTSVQSWLLNENNLGRHGLKECILDHFKRVTPTFEKTFGKVPPKRIDKVSGKQTSKTVGQLIEEAFASAERRLSSADYASLDAYNSTSLRTYFDGLLEKERMGPSMNLKEYFYSVESPFTKVLWKLERRGITVDRGYLMTKQAPVEKEMQDIQLEFAEAATKLSGQPRMINLNAPGDVRFFFYTLLEKPVVHMTDGGSTGNKQPSTAVEVLDEWAGKGCYWAQKLMRYRTISKTYGTYIIGLQEHIDHYSKIHTTFKQTGAQTGRLSSSDPNLQNIPGASEDEYRIREAFVPSHLKKLIVADYSQIEMRLMAHFSQDPLMIKAILDGTDIHCLTVSQMNNVSYDEVNAAKKADAAHKDGKGPEPTPRQKELVVWRSAAKRTGFGIIYGIGGKGLSAQLTQDFKRIVSPEEGTQLIEKWFSVFPGVRAYINWVKGEVSRVGFVQTLLGRFRRFGDVKSMNKFERAQAERQATNAPIQGSAADIIKLAMIQIEEDEELKSYGYEMMLQVHDELVGEAHDDPECVTESKRRIKEIMDNCVGPLTVPYPAVVGDAYSWADAK